MIFKKTLQNKTPITIDVKTLIVSNLKAKTFIEKEFIKNNLERVKEMLENVHGDDAIMVGSTNKDGNLVLEKLNTSIIYQRILSAHCFHRYWLRLRMILEQSGK